MREEREREGKRGRHEGGARGERLRGTEIQTEAEV